jgi:hypothetical protein
VTALLARDVRGRGFRARAGTLCTLIAEPNPGLWLVFVRDIRGHDRATYLRRDNLNMQAYHAGMGGLYGVYDSQGERVHPE